MTIRYAAVRRLHWVSLSWGCAPTQLYKGLHLTGALTTWPAVSTEYNPILMWTSPWYDSSSVETMLSPKVVQLYSVRLCMEATFSLGYVAASLLMVHSGKWWVEEWADQILHAPDTGKDIREENREMGIWFSHNSFSMLCTWSHGKIALHFSLSLFGTQHHFCPLVACLWVSIRDDDGKDWNVQYLMSNVQPLCHKGAH